MIYYEDIGGNITHRKISTNTLPTKGLSATQRWDDNDFGFFPSRSCCCCYHTFHDSSAGAASSAAGAASPSAGAASPSAFASPSFASPSAAAGLAASSPSLAGSSLAGSTFGSH